jgi:hypothetical protein
LKHLGLPAASARSTLAYANQHRPWQLYQTVFQQLLEKCQQVVASAPGKKKRKFRLKNKLLSLDATVIALCVSAFDWAQFRRTKGAVKLHLLLDHDGYLPRFAVVTEGRQHEVRVARQSDFAAGTILAIDRGYTDYEWFAKLTQEGVHLVTRLKDNADYAVVLKQAGVDCLLRRVENYDEKREEVLVFFPNHLTLAAATVAAVYKDRSTIELFFKALKQNLHIKTFVGTSENALQTQIWTALISMLLIKYLQLRARFDWSLSNLVALLRQQLFVYRDLWTWMDNPFQPPVTPTLEQLNLGLG